MSALLRSNKFVRIVSSIARNQFPAPGNAANGSPAANGGGGSGHPGGGGGGATANGPGAVFDASSSFQAWSLQHLHALPAAGGASANLHQKQDEQDGRAAEESLAQLRSLFEQSSLSASPVTREEVEGLVLSLSQLPERGSAQQAQSVLTLRLCGDPLAKAVPDKEERTQFVNQIWTRLEQDQGQPMTVHHYNALLSVYLQNGHSFSADHMRRRLHRHAIQPNQETHEALLQSYCLEGNMAGASQILQSMKDAGHKMSRHTCHALINGHTANGDLKSAAQVVTNMPSAWQITPSNETYLLLCRAHAHQGNINGIRAVATQASNAQAVLSRKQLLEVVHELADAGHKDHIPAVLGMMPADVEENAVVKETSEAIDKMLAKGHDDAAFLMLQGADNQHKGRLARSMLEQLVHHKRPVTKLLWFAEEMDRKNMLTGSMELLLHTALDTDNFSLGLKLAEIYVQDGNELPRDLGSSLLKMCGNSSLDVAAVVKAVGASLSEAELKDTVIPHVEKLVSGPQELLDSLVKSGLSRKQVAAPLIDHLLSQGRQDDAKLLAEKCRDVLTQQHTSLLDGSTHHEASESSSTPVVEQQVSLITSFVPEPQEDFTAAAFANPVPIPLRPVLQMFDPVSQTWQLVPLRDICQRYVLEGRYWDLEQLLVNSQNRITPEDRKDLYLCTLQSYVNQGLYDQAIYLAQQLEAEGLAYQFPEFHDIMGQFAQSIMSPASVYDNSSVGTVMTASQSEFSGRASPVSSVASKTAPPQPEQQQQQSQPEQQQRLLQAQIHRSLKKALAEHDGASALSHYRQLEEMGKHLNVTESSGLIELLVKQESVAEAAEIAERMLERDTYPMPKIFRFLLNKLAFGGQVSMMTAIGQHLSPKVKKEVSFDNRLCNAYLSAGQGAEFLDLLQGELACANTEDAFQAIKDKFPRGGAMGLLENSPHLVQQYSRLAHDFVSRGYVAPMNVLWTYHFINGRHDLAEPLWDKYVRDCPQIMFQKVCQTARADNSVEMACNLVRLLRDARVTSGAQGIAYSCLLDVLSHNDEFEAGLNWLQKGLEAGVKLEDVNRTALLRLQRGLEVRGGHFPYEVPKKSYGGAANEEEERALSPVTN